MTALYTTDSRIVFQLTRVLRAQRDWVAANGALTEDKGYQKVVCVLDCGGVETEYILSFPVEYGFYSFSRFYSIQMTEH